MSFLLRTYSIRCLVLSICLTFVQLYLAAPSYATNIENFDCAELIRNPNVTVSKSIGGVVHTVWVQRSSKGLSHYLRTDRDIAAVARVYDLDAKDFLDLFAGKILDAGAGDGAFVTEMRQHGYNISGVDIFLTPIQEAQPEVFTRQDLAHLKWPNGSFDRIISTQSVLTYELIRRSSRAPDDSLSIQVLREFKRLLKPGGEILIAPIPDDGVFESILSNLKGLVVVRKLISKHTAAYIYILMKTE